MQSQLQAALRLGALTKVPAASQLSSPSRTLCCSAEQDLCERGLGLIFEIAVRSS